MDSAGSVITSKRRRIGIHQESVGSAMAKRIENLLEELSVSNVRSIAHRMSKLNLIERRGQFCLAIMKQQSRFPESSNIYASLVSVINSEFPDVGLLLVKRLVLQIRETYDGNKMDELRIALKFVAHLVNQRVVYEVLALDVVLLLLGNLSLVGIDFCNECGSLLLAQFPWKMDEVLRELERVLEEGGVEKHVEEVIMKLVEDWKLGFKDYPGVVAELDIVEVEDQVIHEVSLLHEIDPETGLNGSFRQDLEEDYESEEEVSSSLQHAAVTD